MTALVVIDEPGIRHRVRDQLQDRGMRVTEAATVAEATAATKTNEFLVAILDLSLSDGSGLEVLDALRGSGSAAHVIILGAATVGVDRVEALQRGADDFVVKPFFLRELTARVLAVRRRRDLQQDTQIALGPCEIDLEARQVSCGGEVVHLTAKEFDLLAYLVVRPGHVFSREQLLNSVWRSTSEWQQPSTVTEHIRRLRTKIELNPGAPDILITVRGGGYRLDLPVTEGAARPTTPQPQVGVIVHVGGEVVFADVGAGDLLGVPDPAALVGRNVLDLICPSSQAVATARQAVGAAGRGRRSEVLQLQRADGEPVTVEVASTDVDWDGTSARRLGLTALSDAPARLRRLVTGVCADLADAVIITDPHFHIRSWNSSAERIYGWSEDAVLGRHILDVLLWVGDGGQLADAWDQLERMGHWNGTATQATHDGSTVDVLGSITLLHDDDGESIGVVSVNRLVAVAGRARALELDTTLATRIREGIADDEFVVHYQPVVDLADGHLVSIEALVRWEHPDRGLLAPAEFLEAAERSGAIVELGEAVLEQACRQAAAWHRSGVMISLSVNVSTRQLAEPGLFDRVVEILGESGFDPAFLWVEVTETSLVEQLDAASRVLRQLVELGVGVAIDDFGTGWASLSYLQSFPVHTLKIDGTFVAGAGRHDSSATAIVRSIISLGAELDLFVIAEGIETQAQHDVLERLGCSLGQGYLYGRPTPAAEVPLHTARQESPLGGAEDPRHLALASVSTGPAQSDAELVSAPASSSGRRSPAALRSLPRRLARAEVGGGLAGAATTVATERVESDAVASLLRGLLRVSSAAGAVDLLQRTVRRMGGTMVPAAAAGDDVLAIDVSLGEGPPLLVEVERFTVARMQLERLLPRLVEDAREAVHLLRRTERLRDETSRDSLTGLGNRRVLDRVLPRAGSGSIVLLDLDHFKRVNDEHGHAAGDDVLRAFGKVLADQVRAHDTTCRIGGEEFAIVLSDLEVPAAVALVDRIRTSWSEVSPRPVTFSAGVAAVSPDGGTAALLAADRAMYRAKDLGRNRTVTAPPAHPAA